MYLYILPKSVEQTMGPPESPWQASTPPSRFPAQNIPSVIAILPYTKSDLQIFPSIIGTEADRRLLAKPKQLYLVY